MTDTEIYTKLINDLIRVCLPHPKSWEEAADAIIQKLESQKGRESLEATLVSKISEVSQDTGEEAEEQVKHLSSLLKLVTGISPNISMKKAANQQIPYHRETIEDYISPVLKALSKHPVTVTGYHAIELAGGKEQLKDQIESRGSVTVSVTISATSAQKTLIEDVQIYPSMKRAKMRTQHTPIVIVQLMS